jgi:hypothetical protein
VDWRHFGGDPFELVFVVVDSVQRRSHRVSLVIVIVLVVSRSVEFLVHREIRGRSPPGGIERATDLLDRLRHRGHVCSDDHRPPLFDNPLGHLGGVGRSRGVLVENLAVETRDTDSRRCTRVDSDDHTITTLGNRFELDPIALLTLDFHPDITGSRTRDWQILWCGIDGENRVRVAAVFLGDITVVFQIRTPEFRFHVAASLFYIPVNPACVAILAPPAAACRAPSGYFHASGIIEGSNHLSNARGCKPGGRFRLIHWVFAVRNPVARGNP